MKKFCFLPLIAFLVILLHYPAFSRDSSFLFKEGNRLYDSGKYADAAICYRKLILEGFSDPALFYNLGCVCFREGKIGESILNFERAALLAPRDRDIQHNLQIARSRIKDEVPAEGFLSRAFKILTIDELTILTSALFFILSVFLIIFILKRKEIWLWGIILFCIIFIFCALWLGARIYQAEMLHSGIIISSKVDVRNGPGREYSTAFILHEGTKVQILNRQDGWLEIGAFGNMRGWLPSKTVEKI